MSEEKKKYDMTSPEAKALIDEIVHGTFVKQGTMVAFPTCFPGASIPIPADESYITALDVSEQGDCYGGTSGRAVHLFVAMFHGVTGMVFDRGTVERAEQCTAICCTKQKFFACVNGPDGGRIVATPTEQLPFDLIQEWGFSRQDIQEIGHVHHERMVHAVTCEDGKRIVGITTKHLFSVDVESSKVEIISELPGAGRIAIGTKGNLFGRDGADHLWKYEPASRQLHRQSVALPAGNWRDTPLTWARNPSTRVLYTADAAGTLFSFDEESGFSAGLGRAPLAPVHPMAVTLDGRIFGFCGAEMAKMFCYDPQDRSITNLGVAVSVIERRRYGYVFGDAVTGRDGQIIFGEDDALGHLWLYFPRIRPCAKGSA